MMLKNFLSVCALAALLISCNSNGNETSDQVNSQNSTKAPESVKDSTPVNMPDTAAINKAWAEFMAPGDMHKWMEKTNGSWEGEISQWMDPAADPLKYKANIVQSSVLGGRYTISKYTGFTPLGKMEGMGTLGYDNAKKIFVSTWIDNMGTGMVHMNGKYDSTTKTLNLKGYQTNPVTGKESDIREEMTLLDNDSYTMILFGTGLDGQEMKFMEGLYKRKK